MASLREYQQDAVSSVYPLSATARKLIVIPTGGGKSWVIADICDREALFHRVLVITHAKALVLQDEDKLRQLSPELDIGVYCADARRKESGHAVTIASVGSIYKRLDDWSDIGLIIIDEAHRITPVGGKLYRAVVDRFPGVPIIGLTATPYRMGTGYLHKGPFKLFDEISYEITYDELVEMGFLVPFASKGSDLAFDTSKLHVRAGEFIQKELDDLVDGEKTRRIVAQAAQRAQERNHWLIFVINKRHADMIVGMLTQLGIPAAAVHSGLDGTVCDQIKSDFENGFIRAMVCVNMHTTGYDFAALDCVWLVRPLASAVLYTQMGGRVVRPAPGKLNALMLDYGGNVSRHGHFGAPELREKQGAKRVKTCPGCGEANSEAARYCAVCKFKFVEMFKQCPKCGHELDRMAQQCTACGYGYPVNENKLDEEGRIILPNVALWLDVDDWIFRVHTPRVDEGRPPKPDCVNIKHKTVDGGAIDEYIFPEYSSTRAKFERWWREHGGKNPMPLTSKQVWTRRNELRTPKRIKVIRNGKFFNFLGKDFGLVRST